MTETSEEVPAHLKRHIELLTAHEENDVQTVLLIGNELLNDPDLKPMDRTLIEGMILQAMDNDVSDSSSSLQDLEFESEVNDYDLPLSKFLKEEDPRMILELGDNLLSSVDIDFIDRLIVERKMKQAGVVNSSNHVETKGGVSFFLYVLNVVAGTMLGYRAFFKGKIITGFLQLFTLGGLGIWAFVLANRANRGDNKNKDGKRIICPLWAENTIYGRLNMRKIKKRTESLL